MDDKLTTKEYWRNVWKNVSLPAIAKPGHDVHQLLARYLPKSEDISLLEIGCAPGRYMAYFNKMFQYSVCGIEYVEDAANATRRNMELQGIQAEVLNEDFFNIEFDVGRYDIVFSGGFIEHFRDTYGVTGRIGAIAKGYVVTMVPNLFGINGQISKRIRPRVFHGHERINVELLRSAHEKCGLSTLFCDYVGGLQFIMPAEKNTFFDRNPRLAGMINLPFRAFNLISRTFGKHLHCCPRTRWLSTHLMYIGKK